MLRTNQTNRKNITNTKKQINTVDNFVFEEADLSYIILFIVSFYSSTTNEKFCALLLMWILKFYSVSSITLDELKTNYSPKLISKTMIYLSIASILLIAVTRKSPYIINIPIVSTDINILITIFFYTIHRLCITFCFMALIGYQCVLFRIVTGRYPPFTRKLITIYFTVPWREVIPSTYGLRGRMRYLVILGLCTIAGFFWNYRYLNSLIPPSCMYSYSYKSGFVVDVIKILHYIKTLRYFRPSSFRNFSFGIVDTLSSRLNYTLRGREFIEMIVPDELGTILFIQPLH